MQTYDCVKRHLPNGRLTLEQEYANEEPVDVIVTFLEENKPLQKRLNLDDFSFSKTRDLLKNLKSSLSEEVILERRSEL